MDSGAVEKVSWQGFGIEGLLVADEGRAWGFLSDLDSQVHSVRQKARRKGLLCGAGVGGDKMMSVVWESCLFPNPFLSPPPLPLLYIKNHHSQR